MAMETKEHILMIHLLAQQNLFLKQLCDALKSNGGLTDEQIKLFGDFLHSDSPMLQVMNQRILRRYLEEAAKVGVVTGLEELEEMLPRPQET
jgi:hypothetical protein